MDSRLDKLEENVSNLKEKVEAIEASRSSPQIDLQPILNCISSSFETILKSMDTTLNEYQTELKELRGRVGTIIDTRGMAEDYTRGIGIIRSELGRLRGSAEAFAIVQAAELVSMQKEIGEMKEAVNKVPVSLKDLDQQLGAIWVEMVSLNSTVSSLEVTARTRPLYDPPPISTRAPSTPIHPRAPPPHASSSRAPRPTSWQGVNVPRDDYD